MQVILKNLQNKAPIHPEKIKKLVFNVLKNEQVRKSGWINICFVDNSQIKKFNAKFLKINKVTDVLAFNLANKQDKKVILADILVSAQEALKQAAYFKNSYNHELSLYVVHGVLHILGYNDHTVSQIKIMRKKESQYVY